MHMREFLEAEHVLYQDTALKASTVKCQILIAKGITKLATCGVAIINKHRPFN